VLCVSLLIVTLDTTVLNVALPIIVTDLHATTTELQWIVDAYSMVFAGFLLVAGSLADRIGRERMFLAGLAAFAAGSTWAAFSESVGMLIAARESMGIGGGEAKGGRRQARSGDAARVSRVPSTGASVPPVRRVCGACRRIVRDERRASAA
jgi:MFS family permease